MEVQVKTEEVDDTAARREAESKKYLTVHSRVTVASGRKDYNSRYTTKYSHGQYLWTEERIFDLIRIYKEYTDINPVYVRNQKPMWESIASKMRDLGHTQCTDSHCHTKYRTLIRQYKVISDRSATPGIRNREFPYYSALSEVFEYTSSNSKNTEEEDIDSEDEPVAADDDKLSSLLVNINKDKKEQDQKRLNKLDLMHREKMDMFTLFLTTFSKEPNEHPVPTRCSKRLSSSSRKRSPSPSDNDFSSHSSDDASDYEELLESEKISPGKLLKKLSKKSTQSKSKMTSLIKKLNDDRKVRDEMKMCRLEKMHDEKMKMFSSFLDVIKKMKK